MRRNNRSRWCIHGNAADTTEDLASVCEGGAGLSLRVMSELGQPRCYSGTLLTLNFASPMSSAG